jgi:hypothetical protein
MIQYKHYHDENAGYVDRLSKSGSNQDTTIFSTLRFLKRDKDTCFTYLPKDGRAYLLQVSERTNQFYHGLSDTIDSFGDTRVAEYINQLEMEHKTDVGPDGFLPEGKLPRRTSEFGLAIARGLNPIFPEAVHALLYTDKPVILVGKDTSALIRYVKVILSLFPTQYANRIGFSVCPDGLPSFFADPGNDIAPHIRLIATDSEISENDSRVVINVTSRPKTENLGPYAAAVARMSDMLEKGNGERLNGLVRSTCPSFHADGSVDREQLETSLAVYNFDSDRNAKTAEALIKAWKADKKETVTKFSVIDAIHILLKEKQLTNEQSELIANAREDSEINGHVANECGQYAYSLFQKGASVTEMQMNDIIEYLGSLPKEALAVNSEELSPIFAKEKTRKVAVLDVLARAYARFKKTEFLSLIAEYVNILDTFNYTNKSNNFDKDILNIASKYKECEGDLLSAIMMTCYIPEVLTSSASSAKTQQRIGALAEFIMSKKLSAVETVEYVLEKKASLAALSDVIGSDVRRPDDFAYLKKADVVKIVDALSFTEKLNFAISESIDIGSYTDLKSAIIVSLASFREVRANVTIGKNFNEYSKFMRRYDSDLRSHDYRGIKEYLNELDSSLGMRKAISDYRCKFVLGSYNSVSQDGRSKIAKDSTSALKNGKTYTGDDIKAVLERSSENENENEFSEKQKIAEIISRTIRESGTGIKRGKDMRNLKYLLYSYMFSAMYVLISAIIFFAIPTISAILLDVDALMRINEFFNLFHVIALISVGVFNLATYLVCWSLSNHDRLGSLKKANVRTFVCCLAPIILYAITYLVTYAFL